MKLLVILLVLALRRLDGGWPAWLARPDRHQRWLAALASGREGTLGWWLAVALPSIVAALLFAWFDGFWGALATLLLGSLLLLWLVGVESEFRQTDELLVRGRLNDPEALMKRAEEDFQQPAGEPDQDWFHALGARLLMRVFNLFSALFWLCVLGPGAALLLVLNRAWLVRHPRHSDWSRSLDAALSWIPCRLTIVAFALVGHFAAVLHAVAGRLWRLDDSRELLGVAAGATLREEVKEAGSVFQAGLDCLEAMHGLLLRALAVWLIFIALWTLLAW
ncbi:hypothetical protein CEK62_10790 [Alcanivorax sp. N3-2A]|nr:hypothetical protein CEK62_10790 [Alcanivorax sp. N3-2A]